MRIPLRKRCSGPPPRPAHPQKAQTGALFSVWMLRCSAISDCTPRPWDHIRGLRMSFRSPDNKIAGARVRGTVARHRKSECKKICSNQGCRGAEDPPTAHRHQHRHHPMPANLLGSDQKKSARHPPGTGWTAACARRSVTAGAHKQPRQCSTKGRGVGSRHEGTAPVPPTQTLLRPRPMPANLPGSAERE